VLITVDVTQYRPRVVQQAAVSNRAAAL